MLDIEAVLGEECESLLAHRCATFAKNSLHLPGPEFVERVLLNSDRSPAVLRNLQTLFDHGRLGKSGYLSILPVDQGVGHSAGASFAPNPIYFDPENIVKLAIEVWCAIIDDFVVCFQYRGDALCLQNGLRKRLAKFSLTLEPTKTKRVEFGRFAEQHASKRDRKRPETIYFLGFTLYCTRNRKGNFKVGFRTEKSRLRRSIAHLSDLMRRMRHLPIQEQVMNLNLILRGHYGYYSIAGNFSSLHKVHHFVERYWRKMLNRRNREGRVTWEVFHKIKACFPFERPRLKLNYAQFQALAVL